jgi:hypothetical protein
MSLEVFENLTHALGRQVQLLRNAAGLNRPPDPRSLRSQVAGAFATPSCQTSKDPPITSRPRPSRMVFSIVVPPSVASGRA